MTLVLHLLDLDTSVYGKVKCEVMNLTAKAWLKLYHVMEIKNKIKPHKHISKYTTEMLKQK